MLMPSQLLWRSDRMPRVVLTPMLGHLMLHGLPSIRRLGILGRRAHRLRFVYHRPDVPRLDAH